MSKAEEARSVESFVNSMIGAFESGFVNSNNLTLATIYQVMRNHCKDEYDTEIAPLVNVWGETTARECHDQKPTHYAVIDEHGEIAHAVRIKSFTDANQDCERYKGLMCNITPQAKDWTVKGVTVHE